MAIGSGMYHQPHPSSLSAILFAIGDVGWRVVLKCPPTGSAPGRTSSRHVGWRVVLKCEPESHLNGEPFTFKNDVLTDVAYCTLYPPDYVFAIATGALGTEVRWKVRRVLLNV